MFERWKKIKIEGFEGRYEISNLGRIRSVTRHILWRDRWGNKHTITRWGKIMAVRCSKISPLLFCDLNGMIDEIPIKKTCYIHKCVADHFIPNPKPLEYTMVAHIDDIPTHNLPHNLKWVDQSFFSLRNLEKNPELRWVVKNNNLKSGYYDALHDAKLCVKLKLHSNKPFFILRKNEIINTISNKPAGLTLPILQKIHSEFQGKIIDTERFIFSPLYVRDSEVIRAMLPKRNLNTESTLKYQKRNNN